MLAGKKCQLHPRRLQCCELGIPDLQGMSVLSQMLIFFKPDLRGGEWPESL